MPEMAIKMTESNRQEHLDELKNLRDSLESKGLSPEEWDRTYGRIQQLERILDL